MSFLVWTESYFTNEGKKLSYAKSIQIFEMLLYSDTAGQVHRCNKL